MQYLLELVRYSDSGDSVVLAKLAITADEAIQIIIDSNNPSQGEARHEQITTDAELFADEMLAEERARENKPAPKRKKYSKPADATEPIERLNKAGGRGTRKCSACGQPGHTARTCGKGDPNDLKQLAENEATDEDPALDELDRMAAEGLSQTELGQMFPSIPIYEIIKAWERHNHL